MIRRLLPLLAILLIAPLARAADGPSYAVRAGRVMPASPDHPAVIENCVIVVRDGRIEAIGADVEPPPDLPLLDLPDMTIAPGLVAGSSGMAGQHAGDASVSGAYAAADAFDRYGDYREVLASGVTTIHLNPGWHRLVSGRGAVVRLGGHHDRRLLVDDADLTVNLGPRTFNPPDLEELLVPAAGDDPIPPQVPQRPTSRMGQYLALKEALSKALDDDRDFDPHLDGLAQAWTNGAPLRVQAQRAVDVAGALAFLDSQDRDGYLVGGIEAAAVADDLRRYDAPLVYTIDAPLRTTQWNIGDAADPLMGDLRDLAALEDVRIAIALTSNLPLEDLRLAGATAMRAGMSEARVLEALTRVPAEILGVDDRVGSLRPGRDADFLVMTGGPLETTSHVDRVFVEGRLVYRRPAAAAHRPTVLRAGTIWRGPNEWLSDGEVLIENGRIAAVGRRVPHPPGARVIDAGSQAFVTPGLIDAHGHLGLAGDRSPLPSNLTLARLVGAPGDQERRVVSAGVTTVLAAPYRFDNSGSQFAAIKTHGAGRDDRVVRPTAAVAFDVAGLDPESIDNRLNGPIGKGQKYLEKWQEYEKKLEEWKKKKAAGELEDVKPKTEESVEEETIEDPITGTWAVRVFGGPLPQEFEGSIALRLTGTRVEGRVVDPVPPMEVRIVGTFDGTTLSGTIDVETGGMGTPTFEATLSRADFLTGTVGVERFSANFEARRTDKSGVEFKVTRSRRRTTGKDGRPLPPPVDESLEPLKSLLLKEIPAVVNVSTTQEIDRVLDTLVDKHDLPVILLNAAGARYQADRLKEKNVAVIVPRTITRREADGGWYHQADDLSRAGLAVALQSDAEDGARLLPRLALHAVERGMSPEEALAALTIDAAKMYRLDDRLGAIEPGRDADLVIFSGHPFDTSSAVLRVIVNGEEVRP